MKDDAAAQQLQRILAGAFAGPPTPLKDIPKQRGESRKAATETRVSDANAKTAKRRAKSPA